MKHWILKLVALLPTVFTLAILGGLATVQQVHANDSRIDRTVAAGSAQSNTLGTPPWHIAESNDIVYLVQDMATSVQRYDMALGVWLTPLSLPGSVDGFDVDDSHLYVASGTELRRYGLDGGDETLLHSSTFPIVELLVAEDFLFLFNSDLVTSLQKQTGALIDTEDYFWQMQGFSVAPTQRLLYARAPGLGTRRVFAVGYEADGTLGEQARGLFSEYDDGAVETWVLPGERTFADNSGIIYDETPDFAGSLGGRLNDLALHDSGVVILRGMTLHRHDANFLEIGRLTVDQPLHSIFVRNETIFGFYDGGSQTEVLSVDLDALVPLVPAIPPDPNGLSYLPNQVVSGGDVLYLLSRDHLSVFRWSVPQQAYLDTIPLAEAPDHIAYSAAEGFLYSAYPPGRITRIEQDVSSGDWVESPFANAPHGTCDLDVVGTYLVVCDRPPIGNYLLTYGVDGRHISIRGDMSERSSLEWNEATGRMYSLVNDPFDQDHRWDVILPNGTLGESMEQPFVGSSQRPPIRPHPTGAVLLDSLGQLYNGDTLEVIEELDIFYIDAQWQPQLTSLSFANGGYEVQYWNDFLAQITRRIPLTGMTGLALPKYSKGVVAISHGPEEIPVFTVLETPSFYDGFESGDVSRWDASTEGSTAPPN